MQDCGLERRLERLEAAGTLLVDRRQIWVGPEVDLDRIHAGVVLHPGARISGANTYLAAGAEVGTEGPATVVDSVFGERARIASGFVSGAVLLREASLGANAHVRAGTLLEEEASTAHAVGLKQTLLLAFVTLGSLINFCDCLMTGGTSRQNHSEVGSGYIHFNFTPWGERGDKATPSLVGDVPRGVFLRQRRIFLGGSGGLVGPAEVGFGSVIGAGQVLRKDVGDGRLVLTAGRDLDCAVDRSRLDGVTPRARKNVTYIAHLLALECWYQQVRWVRASAAERPVIEAALGVIQSAIEERKNQFERFLKERGATLPPLKLEFVPPCPLALEGGAPNHIEWLRSLSEAQCEAGRRWLQGLVEQVVNRAQF